jgi:hypothetical protein
VQLSDPIFVFSRRAWHAQKWHLTKLLVRWHHVKLGRQRLREFLLAWLRTYTAINDQILSTFTLVADFLVRFTVCFVLFCFVLFCFVLFCFVLFCFVLFCFVLFCFVLFCFVYILFCLYIVLFSILSMDITMLDSLSMEKLQRLTQNLIKVLSSFLSYTQTYEYAKCWFFTFRWLRFPWSQVRMRQTFPWRQWCPGYCCTESYKGIITA